MGSFPLLPVGMIRCVCSHNLAPRAIYFLSIKYITYPTPMSSPSSDMHAQKGSILPGIIHTVPPRLHKFPFDWLPHFWMSHKYRRIPCLPAYAVGASLGPSGSIRSLTTSLVMRAFPFPMHCYIRCSIMMDLERH